jgi:hypothetical protein
MAKKAKTLSCRFCGDVLEDVGNRDHLSAWTHSHPSVCPYRQDRMPSLNGIHVGDVWRNMHTGEERTVTQIKLGGHGTYTDREPVFVLDERMGTGGWPMWSLVEHWEPVSRPGVFPVPWTKDKHYRGARSAYVKWRCPAYRGGRRNRGHAYWHAYHSVAEHSIGWEATNRIWQMDPELEARFAKLDERDRRIREFLENADPNDPDLAGKVTDLFAKAA